MIPKTNLKVLRLQICIMSYVAETVSKNMKKNSKEYMYIHYDQNELTVWQFSSSLSPLALLLMISVNPLEANFA